MNSVQEMGVIRPSCTDLHIQPGKGEASRWQRRRVAQAGGRESLEHVALVGFLLLLSWEGRTSVDVQETPAPFCLDRARKVG